MDQEWMRRKDGTKLDRVVSVDALVGSGGRAWQTQAGDARNAVVRTWRLKASGTSAVRFSPTIRLALRRRSLPGRFRSGVGVAVGLTSSSDAFGVERADGRGTMDYQGHNTSSPRLPLSSVVRRRRL